MSGTRSIRAFLACVIAVAAHAAWGQAAAPAQAPLPDGYMRAPPVAAGLAPQMKITETQGTAHVFEAIFSPGDEILSGLTDLAIKHHITSGYVTGLGGLSGALLGFGDPALGAFAKVDVKEKCELVSLVGHIQMRDGAPYVHLHAIVALKDGSTKAGHVFQLPVAPIAEISVVATAIGAH
jgi:uncharacterized protein